MVAYGPIPINCRPKCRLIRWRRRRTGSVIRLSGTTAGRYLRTGHGSFIMHAWYDRSGLPSSPNRQHVGSRSSADPLPKGLLCWLKIQEARAERLAGLKTRNTGIFQIDRCLYAGMCTVGESTRTVSDILAAENVMRTT